MRHLHYILLGLLICACTAERMPKTSFYITVSNVLSTKAKVVIEPSSPDAYYCYGFLNNADLADYYAKSDLDNALFQIDFSKERWTLICQDEGRTVPYADLFCYRGRHEIDYTYLTPDTDHRIIVFQINPDTQELIGNPVSKVFHTKPLVMSDITFTIGFDADLVTIKPSNRDGYCWAYQLTKDILENYGDTEAFYRNLVFMWEDYGFIEYNKVRGPVSWKFSEQDPSMIEGGKYSLAISGYDSDEINTDVTTIDFIYHKNEPCVQVVD